MAAIPNLYLKWRVCRELIGIPQSDAQIGAHIFGEGKEGAPKFSKLLYGDYGCPPEIGTELVAILNRRLENYRKSRGLDPTIMDRFRPSDLDMPLHEFTRKFIAAAEQTDADALDRTQEALLKEMSPGFGSNGDARLVMERYETSRFPVGVEPSGGSGPITLQAGKHKGRLAVLGVDREPAAAYTLFKRDPRSTGHHSWDFDWREMVVWLPSPSRPKLVDGNLHIMPQAAAMQAVPGRFLVTSVLLWDPSTQSMLDPRGGAAKPGALDELETSRFLTNLRRLVRKQPQAVSLSTAEYFVKV